MKKLVKNTSLKKLSTTDNRLNSLYKRVSNYIQTARQQIVRAIDTEMVKTYWLIGREIVEEEQQGQTRALW